MDVGLGHYPPLPRRGVNDEQKVEPASRLSKCTCIYTFIRLLLVRPMSERASIKSSDDDSVLEFTAGGFPDVIQVQLRGCGFSGAIEANLLESPTELAKFFRELAEHWRGWQGKRQWESYEGDLALQATSDSTGHISLAVRLRRASWQDWHLQGSIAVESGQLESIAVAMERFAETCRVA